MMYMFNAGARASARIEHRYKLDFEKGRMAVEHLVYKSDDKCYKMLRMDRLRFNKLCDMLYEHGNLKDKRCVLVDEHLAITLHILGHNVRNSVISTWFQRSGNTVSKVFRRTIRAIIRLHPILLKHPEPIGLESTDIRWKYFQVPNDLLDTIIPEGQELGANDDASNEQPEISSTVGSTNAWTTFQDELAMSIVPNLAISKILSRENNRVRILQEGCKGLLYMVLHARVVLDLCEKLEQEISFVQVEGDFDSFQGR
ncbi:hypothetical protein Sjap_003320 [Stephania japonica]|uniref:DUF8040 domain-containing protein n=1 Tax=Stephania japonica TaxID=461633 RepID=A0AAP0KPG1_9MAGN